MLSIKRGEDKMNDWLNYEGSGSSLSHGFDLGYGYGCGTTRHGSVLVHAAHQGPAQPYSDWRGNLGLTKPVHPQQQKSDPLANSIKRAAWEQQGERDAEIIFNQAANLFRRKEYSTVVKLIDNIRSSVNALLAGKKYTGMGGNSNTRIPGEYINTYVQAFNKSHNLLDTTYDRANQELQKNLKYFSDSVSKMKK